MATRLPPPSPPTPLSAAALQAQPLAATFTRMDPRLQRAGALCAGGLRRRASASTAGDEVAVIAKVSDLDAWNALSEVRPGEVIGRPDADGSAITTARIPARRIEQVRQQPFVISLKAAQHLRRALAATTAETLSRPADLPKGSGVAGGRGVVLGVIDFGADFVHRNFQSGSGRTRIKAIWDQNQPAAQAGGPPYGVVHRKPQIDAALRTASPYAKLGYAVEDGAHGTHVLDIAGGNGRGSGVPGMAPQADLVFVELAASDVPWEGPGVVGANFGDSVQLLEALQFVFSEAGPRPCVVNMSLGTNGGPHDGTTLVEQGIDRLVRAAPNRAVVIAASNSQGDGIHAAGTVPANGSLDLQVRTQQGAYATEDEVEIWFAGARRLRVELIAPDGTRVAAADPGESLSITASGGGPPVGLLANRLGDPNNGDNVINVWWAAAMPKGRWTLRLGSAGAAVPFHAWIERNDEAQASFDSHRVDDHTLGSLSCGHESLVVASYDAHKAARPISWFSSSGPTRDGRPKPEVAAPGHAVVAARSTSKTGTLSMSGTSMAAPAVSGLVALVLARAKKRKTPLSAQALRDIVIGSARLGPPASAWDPRYGAGRICGRDAVARLMPPVVPTAAKSVAARPPARGRSGRR